MEMWMFTMSLRGVWRDHPGCLCVFSWHCELQTGQCSDLTRPFFADSHWEAEPYQRLFLQLKGLRGIELPPGRFQATSQDDSLFPISQVSASSVWARHSETLLTTDCAAAARAEATYNHLKTTAMSRSCLLQQTTIYRTVRGDCPDAGFLSAVLQWFPFIIRHITHGKRMGIQRI